ncbi:MAG: hypothetical protein CFE43_19535 [Burkholderiales bacterium PBB3]|nr:MAG: hypothetical protein CFE43_19535 [Burkholderiales bacterium PBB3]
MKKLSKPLIFALACAGSPSWAVEKFEATINGRTNKGGETPYRFTLELEQSLPGSIKGKLWSWDSKTCPGERPVTGQISGDGAVKFATEQAEVKGCGKLVFAGKKEGDSTLIGKMKFQYEEHEFVFKKQ